jgi:hypothetical protein
MTNRILNFAIFSFATTFIIGLASVSLSSASTELDREASVINEQSARAKDLPGTVVVRVNEATGEASVLELKERLQADSNEVKAIAAMDSAFRAIPASGIIEMNAATELDRNSSASSWYAWYNYGYYYTPTYYYWGYSYSYSNYYAYNWYGYSYRWYRW